jgi:hypothetical protein
LIPQQRHPLITQHISQDDVEDVVGDLVGQAVAVLNDQGQLLVVMVKMVLMALA